MVILQVHIDCVVALKTKRDAPIAAHADRVFAFARAFEGVEAVTGQVHVFRPQCTIKTIQHALNARRVLGGNAAIVAALEKSFKATVLEVIDNLGCNPIEFIVIR